uniref:SHC-transforming protein 3-like n=1 Tax=Labrus bergylta TaxID=56723 RepID=A0A3Q3FSL3_9LABR
MLPGETEDRHKTVFVLITSVYSEEEIETEVCLFCFQTDYECDSDNERNSSAQNVPRLYNINQWRCCNVSRWLALEMFFFYGIRGFHTGNVGVCISHWLYVFAHQYLGCIEVLRSMRSLDFTTRSQITREAISLVCEAVPGTKGALRKRKPPSKALSNILGKSNLQFAGMSINLNISTSSLNLMTPDGKQIIANHHMQSISFASGGDPETTDFVAYVAKDPVNRRACHILECSDSLAQDVISTIGQAFDLRFQQYLQCPSSKLVLNMEELHWTEEEEEASDHPYYNNIPGKMPPPGGFIDARLTNQNAAPDGLDQTYYQGRHCGENWGDERKPIFIQQGSFDISSLPDSKGQTPKTGEMPTYVNTQQIDAQVLGMAAAAKESPQKDLFDMKEGDFSDLVKRNSD